MLLQQTAQMPVPMPMPAPIAPNAGPITITGEITCLPKRGTTGQTLECAIGLRGSDGLHYGLKNLSILDPEYQFSVGGMAVEVSGTFQPEMPQGPDGNQYDVVGVIDIIAIKETPKVGGKPGNDITEPENPEDSGLAKYPDEPLNTIPATPMSIQYLIEHRSALNDKVVTIKGIVVADWRDEKKCSVHAESLCPQPKIFLSDTSGDTRSPHYDLLVQLDEKDHDYVIGQLVELHGTVYGYNTVVQLTKKY